MPVRLLSRSFAALAVLSFAAACGGTVVFEEDGGQGGQSGEGGSQSTSTQSAQGGASTTSTTSGPTTNSTTSGPTTSTGTGSGGSGCGTLLGDLGSLGLGPDCDVCAQNACCGELAACTAGTDCNACIFQGNCSDQAEQDLNALSNCLFGPCNFQCNQNSCNDGDFTCNDGSCIPYEWVCDGGNDCSTGEDESPDVCANPCGPGNFACNDGACIPNEWVCDNIVDCPNGEDELCNECDDNQFTCNNGGCIPNEWVCDGDNDCGDNSDEFCGNPGVCDSGLDTGDPQINACLGDACCLDFEACTSFGEEVDTCFDCLNEGGGPLCDDAIQCAQASGCFGGPELDICGTGYSTGDVQTDQCLTGSCCDGWLSCLDAGEDACIECLNAGGGELCDPFWSCACDACGLCP